MVSAGSEGSSGGVDADSSPERVVLYFDFKAFERATQFEHEYAIDLWARWHSIVDEERKSGSRYQYISVCIEVSFFPVCLCLCAWQELSVEPGAARVEAAPARDTEYDRSLMCSRSRRRSRPVARRTAIISLPSASHEILGTEGGSHPCEDYLLVAWARSLLRKRGPAALPVAFALVSWARSLLRAWPVRAVLLASCSMALAVRGREGPSLSLRCRLPRGLALSCSSMRLRMPWETRRCLRWRLPPRVLRLRVGVRSVAL